MFVVTYLSGATDFWLRSTVWTSARERATEFETREAAQAALDKAKQFMKASVYKQSRIVEV
jgi:hypothetical protein